MRFLHKKSKNSTEDDPVKLGHITWDSVRNEHLDLTVLRQAVDRSLVRHNTTPTQLKIGDLMQRMNAMEELRTKPRTWCRPIEYDDFERSLDPMVASLVNARAWLAPVQRQNPTMIAGSQRTFYDLVQP